MPDETKRQEEFYENENPSNKEEFNRDTTQEESTSPEVNEQDHQEESMTNQDSEKETEQSGDSEQPVAILRVNGADVPVYSKDELIKYAQMGFDYALKIHELKRWKNLIQLVLSNPYLKDLVDKASQGEDIGKYIVNNQKSEDVAKQEITTEEDADITKDVLEKAISKTVEEKLQPHLTQLQATMFIQNLRASDPKYADIVFQLMLAKANDPNTPPGLKYAMATDPNTFLAVYRELREQVIQLEKQQNKKSSKPIKKQNPPTLEGGKSSPQLETQMIDEAKKIWEMSSEEFEKWVRKNKGF